MNEINGYVVFTDLKGFSNMNEPETFYEHTIRPLAKKIKEYKNKAEVWNTWGDALVAVFKKGTDAIELMIAYRDFFRKNKLLGLQPRIAGHHGEMKIYNDPMINNMENVLGDTVNTAARIEPITFPGEIYVSSKFYERIQEEKEKAKDKEPYSQFEFTCLGVWDMAKKHGKIKLYRVFDVSEESWNINSLFVKNENENIDILFGTLNIDDKIKAAKENEKIKEARQLNSKKDVIEHISDSFPTIFKKDNKTELIDNLTNQIQYLSEHKKINGPLLIALAELFRDIGEYEKAIDCISAAKEWKMSAVLEIESTSNPDSQLEEKQEENKKKYWIKSMKDVTLYPFKENSSILKLEADIKSKKAYMENQNPKEAKEILTKLLQQNPNDTGILTKLAAQLKREAFQLTSVSKNKKAKNTVDYETNTNETEDHNTVAIDTIANELDSKEMDEEKRKVLIEERNTLLKEANYLYLEAFRKDRDYYSAINAAYIYKILRDSNGWHLATYIFNTWNHETGEDWWKDSTLAETQLLLGEFKFCFQRMERAVKRHNPPFFERHATKDQIEMFINILKDDKNVKDLSLDEKRYAALLSILLEDPSLITEKNKEIILKADENLIEKYKNDLLINGEIVEEKIGELIEVI